jgi:hypothetical protein
MHRPAAHRALASAPRAFPFPCPAFCNHASLNQQAESNFTTLINTLTHQKEVYQKAEYKKRQGIDTDDEEKELLEAKKKEEETKKKQAAIAEARKKEVADKEASRKAKEAAEKEAATNGTNGVVAAEAKPKDKDPAKPKEDGDESDEDDESKGAKPVHNGGITDKYTWTQTLQELQIVFSAEQLGLAPGLPLKSRDLTVDVKKKHLKIALKGKTPLVDGELHKEVCCLSLAHCVS